jgi:hypothetical protein
MAVDGSSGGVNIGASYGAGATNAPTNGLGVQGKVGIGTLTFGTNNMLIVNPYSTVDNLASAQINTTAATNKGLVVQGFASQSADLQDWEDSSGTKLASISSSGGINAASMTLSNSFSMVTPSGQFIVYGGASSGTIDNIYIGSSAPSTGAFTTLAASSTVTAPNLATSSAATTGTVCWTTGTGNFTVDTTLACLASLEELKDKHGDIKNALGIISKINPFWFTWKKDTPEYAGDTYEQAGMGAHQVESVDPRLAAYTPDGKLKGVRYQEMTAVLVAAVKEQQQEIENLKAAVASVNGHRCYLVFWCN